ncbi:MAG TPA: FKBP-type peptidyl-prolyl cis-trans isomerase [Actinoplanes sp.]|jgi:peptidylprolyl isomerase
MSTPAPATKRRGQAVAGALAGLAVVLVLVAVFIGVKASDSDKPATEPAAQAAASQPAAQPTAAAPPSEAVPPGNPSAVNTPAGLTEKPVVKGGTGTVTEIKTTVLVAGRGPVVQKGQTITANYLLVDYKTGKELDSSWQRGEPFSTPIGTGAVIKGWDQGIPGQKVGSRIQLDVPEALAYPGKGDLRFVVDILAAQ